MTKNLNWRIAFLREVVGCYRRVNRGARSRRAHLQFAWRKTRWLFYGFSREGSDR